MVDGHCMTSSHYSTANKPYLLDLPPVERLMHAAEPLTAAEHTLPAFDVLAFDMLTIRMLKGLSTAHCQHIQVHAYHMFAAGCMKRM